MPKRTERPVVTRINAGAVFDAGRACVEVSGQVLVDGLGAEGAVLTVEDAWGQRAELVTGVLGSFGVRLTASRTSIGTTVSLDASTLRHTVVVC